MRNSKDIKHLYNYSAGDKHSSVLFQPSIVSECRLRDVPTEKGIDKKFCNDIYLLFHQKRLENLGIDTINNWLSSLTPLNDSLSSLRSKCTDEELLSLVKSRHIQSMSELLAWSNYLEENYSSLLAKINSTSDSSGSDSTVITVDSSSSTSVASSV